MGVLFNVVEDVVGSTMPEDAWDHVLADSDLCGAYTSLGDYDGAELGRIVAALSERTGLPPDEVLRFAGEHGYRHLAGRHADLVTHYPSFGALLHNLDAVIHPEVLKLYPQARPPRFEVADAPASGPQPAEPSWIVTYRSERRLCHLADGLMRGAAGSFGHRALVEQTTCVHRGDDACVFLVSIGGGPERNDPPPGLT